jgi:hypothetical protein
VIAMGLVGGQITADWRPNNKPMAVIAPAMAAIISVAVIATSSAIVEGHPYWLSFALPRAAYRESAMGDDPEFLMIVFRKTLHNQCSL